VKLAALILLAWLSTARASVLFATGGDEPDEASGTATDSFSFTEAGTGADSTAKLVLSGHRHRSSNGGGNESLGAFNFTPGSGVSRYYEAVGWTVSQATLGFSANPQAAPSVARAIAEIRMGANRGCLVTLNTDRTLSVYYATTGTSFGTTAAGITLALSACSGDPLRSCTVSGDCVTPQTCTACNTGTGAGCYWGGLELTQTNFPSAAGDAVTCDLRRNGAVVISSVPTPATGLSTITGFRIGGIDTEASALNLDIDDVVFDDASRTGFGYVAPLFPTGTGQTQSWTVNACGSGATGFECVNDWVSGGLYDSTTLNDTMSTAGENRTAEFWPFSSVAVASGASVSSVHPVIVGRTTSGGSARILATSVLSCASLASCAAAPEQTTTLPDSITHQLLQRSTFTTTAGNAPWSGAELAKIGLRMRRVSGSEAARAGAVVIYAVVTRPDEKPPSNLADHNLGVNDGIKSAFFVGDSLAGGTCSSTCQFPATNAGAVCSQSKYCSWSATLDQPSGGCTTDGQCRTCSLRKTDANGGAGFPCTADVECGNIGTCSGGVCSQNDGITCTGDNDCRNLGTCDSTATCVDACPGGSCPGRTGWPFYTVGRIGADVIVSCSQGGESSSTMVANRADGILAGKHSTCLALQGTGVCECNGPSDCGSGGACTSGLCTAGDAAHMACTESTACVTGKVCAFPPPDYIGVLEGVNDCAQNSAPNCDNPIAATLPALTTPGSPCNSGCNTALLCSTNSDCSANGPSSTCVGASSDAQRMCTGPIQLSSSGTNASCGGGTITSTSLTCSASISGCNSSATCPNGQTCSTSFTTPVTGVRITSASLDPLAVLWPAHGFCECANDGQCTGGFKCLGNRCRRPCSTDSMCSSPTVAGTCNVGAGACKGTCTCPCDRATCSTSSDCPVVEVPLPGGLVDRFQGECVSGRCKNCGPMPCPFEAGTKHAFNNTERRLGGRQMTDALHKLEAKINAGTDTDGRPVLLVMTQPEYSYVHPCTSAWADAGYLSKVSARARREFPHVVDLRRATAALRDPRGLYSDMVHFTAIGASFFGGILADYLGTFNRCVQWDQVTPTSQKYCQTPAGAWQAGDVACATAAGCTLGNLCVSRACTTNSDCPAAGDTCHLE
jgi:hypothetical protein